MSHHRTIRHALGACATSVLAVLCGCTTEPADEPGGCEPGCEMNAAASGGSGVAGLTGAGGVGGAPGIGGATAGNAGTTPTAGAGGTGGSASAAGSGGSGGASAGGAGGTGGAGGAGGAGAGGTGGAGQMLPPITDYAAPGPFAAISTPDDGPDGSYTIFRPDPLGEDGFLHPPMIWGPGIFTQVSSYTTLLTTVASHGFVVVAVGSLSSGPGDQANLTPMEDGLEWILAQNDQPGVYQGKLDVNRAVAMGYSVGGTAAVQVGAHPSIVTTISVHGHSAMSALHGPLLQTSGTGDSIGLPLQQETFDASMVQTFLATVDGASHTYILADGGGAERPAIIAWLRFWVFGDEGARPFFYGDDCTLCKAPWTDPQRKNWP